MILVTPVAEEHAVAQRDASDAELMLRVAEGDLSAFDLVFSRYHHQIFNFVRRQTASMETAEDLLQEVFLRVYRSAKNFDPTRKFSSWLYRIALNEVKRHWKRNSAKQTYSLNAPLGDEGGDAERQDLIEDSRPGPEELAGHAALTKDLRALIERLPEKQKTVVMLKVYQELTFEQIAEVCECPLSTVLSRMRYAVSKLRRWLGMDEGGDAYGL